jgi:parallel beta-helix repeat protein
MRETNLKANLGLSVFLLLLAAPVQAATIKVGPIADNDFFDIQAGIDAARVGDTVLVAPGEYIVSEPVTFRGKDVTLKSVAGPDSTIIQMGTPTDPNRASVMVFKDVESAASVIDGFTITGGRGFRLWDTYLQHWHGGGILFEYSSATIRNCVIVRNSAVEGGGISCVRWSFPRLINCTITENSATLVGGGMQSYLSSPVLTNCTFTSNTVEGSGGGMCNEDSSPTITNCTFSENYADSEGGGISTDDSNPILLNCTFIGNSAGFSGGGLINHKGDGISTITNCIFSGNSALYSGGGICNGFESSAILTNCTFSENWAKYGGGFGCEQDSNTTLIDCILNDNQAETSGGGLINTSCDVNLTNCTFSNNISEEYGGAMSGWGSNLTLTSCTFSENSTGRDGGGMRSSSCEVAITDCSFKNNSAQSYGGGIANSWGNNTTINNCTFCDNRADRGGAMENRSGNSVLFDCIFTANTAGSDGGSISNEDGGLEIYNSLFSGNLATISGGALYNISDSILTVTNCTFAGNLAQNGTAFICADDPFGESIIKLINCIVWDGVNGIWNSDDDSTIDINYSDIRGGRAGIYDPYQTVTWGEGNIDEDPLFIEPGCWDPNDTPEDPNDDFWIDGDYHLKSQIGRYDPNIKSWVIDDVTSSCIDAGDPNSLVCDEPEPNGGIINMGAYGGTAEASKSTSN